MYNIPSKINSFNVGFARLRLNVKSSPARKRGGTQILNGYFAPKRSQLQRKLWRGF